MLTLVSLLSLSLTVFAQGTTRSTTRTNSSVSRTSSAVSRTVSISSAATPSPSSDPFGNVSAGCKSALEALESAASSCPVKDTIGSYFTSKSGSLNITEIVPILCSNPACKENVNSLSALLINGACKQDKIDFSSVSGSPEKSGDIPVPLFGLFTSTSHILTCQKTSDNKGYCGASSNETAVMAVFVIAPFAPELKLPTLADSPTSNSGKSICTDCSKNGLTSILESKNLSEEARSSIQKFSTDLDTYCGKSYKSIPGTGGLGDSSSSSSAISGALSTLALLAAVFVPL